jgi:hypothetical protein
MNGTNGKSIFFADYAEFFSGASHCSNFSYDIGINFGASTLHSDRPHLSVQYASRMANVLTPRNILKIFQSVIGAISVFMVGLHSSWNRSYESTHYELMDHHSSSLTLQITKTEANVSRTAIYSQGEIGVRPSPCIRARCYSPYVSAIADFIDSLITHNWQPPFNIHGFSIAACYAQFQVQWT